MASKAPSVSVVVPTYRRSAWLSETLDSVFAQTFADLEVIVVEDGSHEAATTLAKYGDRVRYVWQPNQGVGVARNAGVRHSRGDWIAFLDDDDWWEPQKLERQLAYAERNPQTGLVHTDHRAWVDGTIVVPARTPPRDLVPSGWISAALFRSNFIVTSSTLVRRSEFERAGGFTANREWAEDLDLWLKLSRICPIGYVNEPLTIYRDHARSLSSDIRWHLCRINVLEHFVESDPAIGPEYGRLALRRRMRDVCWNGAYGHFMHGEYAIARRLFLRAWRWMPWDARALVYGTVCLAGAHGVRAARAARQVLR